MQSNIKWNNCFCCITLNNSHKVIDFKISLLKIKEQFNVFQASSKISFRSFSWSANIQNLYNCPALGFYLEKAVHVGFHVRDGHPLHDDVIDASLQWLPLGPGWSVEVDTSHPHWGTPKEEGILSDVSLSWHAHSRCKCANAVYLAPLEELALEDCSRPGTALWEGSWGGSGRLTFLLTFPDTGLTWRLRAVTWDREQV